MLGRLAAGVALLALISGCAFGQSSPNWASGYVPTPAQWNAEWASKQDYIGPLGNGATLNIGTTAGTLAAGNDPRITGAAQTANNGSDYTNPAAFRVNLGFGSIATQNSSAVALTGGTITGVDISGADVTATGSSTPRTTAAMAADVANVLNFGADPTGTTDTTAAIKAALATNNAVFLPCGTYHITNSLAIAANNQQRLHGAGDCSQITIGSDFNTSASGVILLDGTVASGAATVDDLSLTFSQPPDTITTASAAGSGNTVAVSSVANIAVGDYVYDNTTPANIASLTTVSSIVGTTLTLSASAASIALNDSLHFSPSRSMFKTLAQGCTVTTGGSGCAYPSAFYMGAASGPTIRNVTVNAAWNGISLAGPGGDYNIQAVRMGALNNGLSIDNLADAGVVRDYKFWNFGFSSSSYNGLRNDMWSDGATECATPGRSDGGSYEDMKCFTGNITLLPTFTVGLFRGLNFNGRYATFNEPSGVPSTAQFSISGIAAETGGTVPGCIINLQGAASALLSNMAIFGGGDGAGGGQQALCVGGGRVVATGGIFQDVGGGGTSPLVTETGGSLLLEGVQVEPNSNQSVAPIQISNGTYYILNNVIDGSYGWSNSSVPFISITETCSGFSSNAVAGNNAPPGHPISGLCKGFDWPNSDTVAWATGATGSITTINQPNLVAVQNNNTVGAATLAIGQILGNVLTRGGTQTANFTDTTPTAATIVGEYQNPQVGQIVRLRIVNTTGYTETIAGGTGVTTSGTMTIAAGAWRDFDISLTNVTSGSQAVTFTNIGGGTL